MTHQANIQPDMITPLSVQTLLGSEARYLIPMYQRNYAWEEGEISQLIEDVLDYQLKGTPYYIGTLVVFERMAHQGRPVFEVIDGQQRLTTLSLLLTYLRHLPATALAINKWYHQPNIEFDCRAASQQTMTALFKGAFVGDSPQLTQTDNINSAIENGYRIIHKLLLQKCQDHKIKLTDFSAYLQEKVQILRVKVPADTDLNYYFEVMNSRGEQLEKHEVLKARLLAVLSKIEDSQDRISSERALHWVWEACANMDHYAQTGFNTTQRSLLFSEDWSELQVTSFSALSKAFLPVEKEGDQKAANEQHKNNGLCIDAILRQPVGPIVKAGSKDCLERFHAVINFPNFLLQVLRVMQGQDVPLDDKRLLQSFDTFLLNNDSLDNKKITRVKNFIFALLRCKHLFDHCVIKREFVADKEGWSLKRYKKDTSNNGYYVKSFGEEEQTADINCQLLMLLAAFHVSAPTQAYKHWLNAALYWLYQSQSPVSASAYLAQLESVAKAFVFDRFLAAEGAEYFSIIYQYRGHCQTVALTNAEMKKRLCYGKIQNNLVFNYLDYLLWLHFYNNDDRIKEFEFTARSSVEHYYPQHPLPGFELWDDPDLNCFGNLCLISHSKNSRLSNLMPEAKQSYYKHNKIDSIKQYLMMKGEWNTANCKAHQNNMFEVLKGALAAR